MTDRQSISEHKITLAEELLDDIELGRLPTDKLLLKATRLARLINSDEVIWWLHYEMVGFNAEHDVSLRYMDYTGRWLDKPKKQGYWWGLAQIEAQIAANEAELRQLRVPDVSFSISSANPKEYVAGAFGSNIQWASGPVNHVLTRMADLSATITNLSGVRSRVLDILHRFVANTYYELLFSGRQETIFERQRTSIDSVLLDKCADVLQKVPSVYDRLAANDPEAVSQALTTCRRMIDAFADKVFPPRDGTFDIGGVQLKLDSQHHKNRINAYVYEHCTSTSLRETLRKRVDLLYDRVAAGIHGDVSPSEARFRFFDTYMLLGEIASLGASNQANPAGRPTEQSRSVNKLEARPQWPKG